MTIDDVLHILERDAVDMYSLDGLKKKLQSGRKLKIKLGADPSRPDLHLGHSVVLRKLKLLQELGHEIVFVIGDFTGMIGDPTGKSKTRPSLTLEQTRESGKSYFEQVTKILDPEKTTICYNSEWLDALKFSDVIKLAGHYTLARVLERDDFAKRFHDNQPIGLHEILYPLVQGYDSVAIGADVEVGGTDQIFNLLVGRKLQKDYDQEPQEVITFGLLTGLDGKEKMSKSLNNYIGISEAPDRMFEKAMKIPDFLMLDYFRLTTDVPLEKAESLIKKDIREAHFCYAHEIVSMYHDEAAAISARMRYDTVAKGKLPDQMATIVLDEDTFSIIELIKRAGFAKSNSEARRLIQGRGIKIDGAVILDIDHQVTSGKDFVLSKGKSSFVRFAFR